MSAPRQRVSRETTLKYLQNRSTCPNFPDPQLQQFVHPLSLSLPQVPKLGGGASAIIAAKFQSVRNQFVHAHQRDAL